MAKLFTGRCNNVVFEFPNLYPDNPDRDRFQTARYAINETHAPPICAGRFLLPRSQPIDAPRALCTRGVFLFWANMSRFAPRFRVLWYRYTINGKTLAQIRPQHAQTRHFRAVYMPIFQRLRAFSPDLCPVPHSERPETRRTDRRPANGTTRARRTRPADRRGRASAIGTLETHLKTARKPA